MFFAVLTVILPYIVLQWYSSGMGVAGSNVIWSSICLLLPLNILIFSLLKERGILSLRGSTRFSILLVQFVIVIGLAQLYPIDFNNLMNINLVSPELMTVSPFPQLSVIVMLLSLLVLNGRIYVRPDAQNSALFVGLLTSIVMLYFRDNTSASAVFACVVMLMFTVAVVQESWSMAYIDQLTNLPGRRALEEDMLKLGGSYTIAMVDIDHFKTFNDSYGHDAGDQVLNMVAARIKGAGRGGKAFRYGGEEFTLIFQGKNINEASDVLEDVRNNICGSRFQLRQRDRRQRKRNNKAKNKNVKVTVSIGVANRNERLSYAKEVLKAADKALYRAKKKGRNRVSM